MHIGTIWAAAVFKQGLPEAVLVQKLSAVEIRQVDGVLGLPAAIGDQFSSLCNLRLQELMRGSGQIIPTLRTDGGTGWADYRRGRYELACELVAAADDVQDAENLLLDAEILERFEPMLRAATGSFVRQFLPSDIFSDFMASYAVET